MKRMIPTHFPLIATPTEKTANDEEVQVYWEIIVDALKSTRFTGEYLWIEFTATSRKHTIAAMPKQICQRWVAFLVSCGVHITCK